MASMPSIEGRRRISRAGVRESSVSLRRVRNNLLNYRMPKVTSARREAGVGGGILHEGVGGVDARAKQSDDAWTVYFAESRTPVQLSTINENWPIREPRIHRASTHRATTIAMPDWHDYASENFDTEKSSVRCTFVGSVPRTTSKKKKKFRIRKYWWNEIKKIRNLVCVCSEIKYIYKNKIKRV